jgi:hypothetical protein
MNASETVADRIAAGRAVYARNLGVPEDEAESMLAARAGAQYAREAFLAAGGPGWAGTELTDRDRSVAGSARLTWADEARRTANQCRQDRGRFAGPTWRASHISTAAQLAAGP